MFLIIQLLLPIIFGLIAIICLVISIILSIKEESTKSTTISFISSILLAVSSIITYSYISIPKPVILPLNSDIETYSGNTKIEIESDNNNILNIYYSLDGDDPKNGKLYENPIIIYESTVVCARSKFLWWWSDISKNTFGFEEIAFNNNVQFLEEDYNPDLQEESEQTPVTMIYIPNLEDSELAQDIESTTEQEDSTEIYSKSESSATDSILSTPTPTNTINTSEGINTTEGYNLITYVNQYRSEAGVGELIWNSDLEQEAQNYATLSANGEPIIAYYSIYYTIGRQCNGAKNAQKAVSDWITGNDYIPSEAEILLNTEFTQMGGALYYSPNGNEYGYHYFWIICLL